MPIRLCNEVDESYCRRDCQPSVAWLQASILPIATVSGSVKTSQLSQMVGELRKIAEYVPNIIRALCFVANPFRNKLKFF